MGVENHTFQRFIDKPSVVSRPIMALLDDETRQLLIKKTWCHGQAVMPMYGMVCLWWYLNFSPVTNNNDDDDDDNENSTSQPRRPLSLLVAALILPLWSYLSYRSVAADNRTTTTTTTTTSSITPMVFQVVLSNTSRVWVCGGTLSWTCGSCSKREC